MLTLLKFMEVTMFRIFLICLFFYSTSISSALLAAGTLSKNEIYEIQEKLNLLGHPAGKPDGISGRKTRLAIEEFLEKYDVQLLPEVSYAVLDQLRSIYLDQPELVLKNLTEPEFLQSELANVHIPENYKFFISEQRLTDFHTAYGPFVDPFAMINNSAWDLSEYFDDCERAISEFDTSWNKLQIQSRFIRCMTAFSHIHFADRQNGIKSLENILKSWSKLQPVIYRSKSIDEQDNQSYAASMTVASISHFYAIYYHDFDFNETERKTINEYLKNWLITEDMFNEVGRIGCNFSGVEKDFATSGYFLDADNCGSNRWRMGLAAVYLGLRLNDELLFKAGNRHVFRATAAIDRNGIYMPWARKGALALSYQRQLPEVLTFLADAYASVGFDFYNFETWHGTTIADVYQTFFEFIDDPDLLDKYAKTYPKFAGVDYNKFKKLSLSDKQKQEMIFHDVLSVQSEGYLRTHSKQTSSETLIDSWDKHWGDYVGIFMMASGVGVSYSTELNKYDRKSVSLPIEDYRLASKNQNVFKCNVSVLRHLNGETNRLGGGDLMHDGNETKIQNFRWEIQAVEGSDFIEKNSALVVRPNGELFGALALHTMSGSTRLDLVPFQPISKLMKAGSPEGDHTVEFNNFQIIAKVSNCIIEKTAQQNDEQQNKAVLSSESKVLKLSWHTELSDEGYKRVLEAYDMIEYNIESNALAVSHFDVSADSVKGRDILNYRLSKFGGGSIIIGGEVDVLNGDKVKVRIKANLSPGTTAIEFGRNDRLVLTWE